MNDSYLIQQVKLMKAEGKITRYYEIAQQLNMSQNSFYNWMNGAYTLGYTKKNKLIELIRSYEV